jgi:hypothetical protein
VYRAPLNVAADSKSRVYGAANPALTYTITGFQNGEDSSVVGGAPAISTTATASSDVGAYPVTVSQGTLHAANYYFTFTNGTLTVTPQPVTVSVIGAQVYGSAAAFAGTPSVKTLTVSGITCTTVNGGTSIGTALPFGSYTIDGSSCSGGTLSSSDYSISSFTGGAYTVYRAALTVTADDQSRVYGAANPTLTYTISGFQNGDDASVVGGAPAISTAATPTSDVGSYPISVSQGTLHAANYYFVFANGTLTVAPKPVTVSVFGAQVYGSAPAFAASTGVTGLTVSGVTCTNLANSAPIDSSLPAGTYSIDGSTCSGGTLSSTNYTIAGYTGTAYYVYRAALTVTANDQSRPYGAANPTLTYTITGFQNGDDASVVGGAPAVSTTASTTSDVGSYPISISQGTLHAANYYFVFANGTLTVTQAPVTVSVIGAQIYGGAAVFAGTPSVKGLTVSNVVCTGLTNNATIAPTVGFGTYTIDGTTCSGGTLSSSDYTISGYTGSTFTVYRAALTVTPDNAARNYGAANPAFTYTISGFVNSEDASVVGGAPAISTTATSSSDVGSYPITASQGTLHAANYYFVFNTGTLTINQAPLAVSVIGAQIYGSAPAFAGSVAAKGVTVSGVTCTALTNGSTISAALNFGTYTIDGSTCSGGTLSSPNYVISGYTGSTYTVYRAALMVTADNQSRTYGAPNPALTYTFSGFKNGDTAAVVSGSAAVSTTATSTSGVGSYPITVAKGSLFATNYYFVFTSGTLTVGKAPLTVTADNKTRAYGASNPALTYTIAGFVNGDTAAVVSGTPTLATTATPTSDPGTFPITVDVTPLSAANYSFVAVPGSLTVTKATTTMTTSGVLLGNPSATLTYGPANTPIVGVPVTFAVGNTTSPVICTSVTDATGKATCVPTLAQHLSILTNGYTASFAGTTDFTAASNWEK